MSRDVGGMAPLEALRAPLVFDLLMRDLQRAHEDEVGRLRAEIETLRSGAGPPSPSSAGAALASPALAPSLPPPPEDAAAGASADVERMPSGGLAIAVGEAVAVGGEGRQTTQTSDFDFSASAATPKASKSTPQVRRRSTEGTLQAYMEDTAAGSEFQSSWTWSHCGHRVINSTWFEVAIGACIFLNIALIFAVLELRGRDSGASIGATTSPGTTETQEKLDLVSSALTVVFAIELSLKLLILRSTLFFARGQLLWHNIFDATIVVLGCVDSWIFLALDDSAHLSLLRAFRVVRILRVFRVARTLHVFSSLRILVSAVFASFLALFWSMVLLSIVMLMSGLFLCQSLVEVIEDPSYGAEIREWVYLKYGTSTRACWTMFELTFSGGWPNYANKLVEEVHAGYAVFFFLYVSAVIFAMFRIITALFLKDTLRVAALDIDCMITEKLAEKLHYAEKLADFFAVADASGDGLLTLEEFDTVLADDRVRAYFTTLDLDPTKTRSLFLMADRADSGAISIDDFVECAMQLKGTARAQDVAGIMRECGALNAKVTSLDQSLHSLRELLVSEVALQKWTDL